MKKEAYTIIEEKNVIDDHLLDIIGNEFKFDHQKGLSEWLKNSADAYIRADVPDEKQFVFLRFNDGERRDAVMECVDFVGMTVEDITKAFKRWGDPEAAKRGLRKRTYGGHGNGGKFYMRQMFKQSYFITYHSGRLNVFGFSPKRKYGFAEGYKDVPMTPETATKFADVNSLFVPKETLERIHEGKTGFTVVRGIGPLGMVNKIKVYRIQERLKTHPQARRLLERMRISVIHNGNVVFDRILPDRLDPKQGFETPFVFDIPEKLDYVERGERYKVEMANKRFSRGRLILKTSDEALEYSGRFGDLNRVDVLGEIGVIASYRMHELGSIMYPQAVFIYGECKCPILEDPDDDCVKNDRSKLIAENPKTKALLEWVGERVNEVAEKILEKEKAEQEKLVKEYSQAYNEFLNRWSSRFLNRIRAELLMSPGEGPGAGFGTGGSSGGFGGGKGGKGGKKGGGAGDKEGGGGTPKRRSRLPRVLLSGMDSDPLNPEGELLYLDPRQGVIYQRLQDVREGIYWINTSSPMAKAVLGRFGEGSQQWRSYLFQRYVDIFVREELRDLFKKDTELFNPDVIDTEVFNRFLTKVHEAASQDLGAFLLEDRYEVPQENR